MGKCWYGVPQRLRLFGSIMFIQLISLMLPRRKQKRKQVETEPGVAITTHAGDGSVVVSYSHCCGVYCAHHHTRGRVSVGVAEDH